MFNYCVSSDVRRNIALHSHLQACCCCKLFYVRDRLSHFELTNEPASFRELLLRLLRYERNEELKDVSECSITESYWVTGFSSTNVLAHMETGWHKDRF